MDSQQNVAGHEESVMGVGGAGVEEDLGILSFSRWSGVGGWEGGDLGVLNFSRSASALDLPFFELPCHSTFLFLLFCNS